MERVRRERVLEFDSKGGFTEKEGLRTEGTERGS